VRALQLLISDRRVTEAFSTFIARRMSQVGVAGWPVTGRGWGAFSTLLRRPVLRASNGGVMVT